MKKNSDSPYHKTDENVADAISHGGDVTFDRIGVGLRPGADRRNDGA